MKKIKGLSKIKRKKPDNTAGSKTVSETARINDRYITNIPHLRNRLREMIAGVDLARKYNEPEPVIPDNIHVEQKMVKPRPYLVSSFPEKFYQQQ